MSEYLSKEEIKQWRSSLEKITLEEFAARLGKKIEVKKETNDLVDIVLHGKPVVSSEQEWNMGIERLSSIADRAYEKEKDLYISSFSVKNLQESSKSSSKLGKKNKEKIQVAKNDTSKISKKAEANAKTKAESSLNSAKVTVINETSTGDALRDKVRIVFKKALTDREQRVFDYFSSHKDQVVYAKDLAQLLDLPKDYVYKYIKNLRAKIDGEALKNADKGGFILSI